MPIGLLILLLALCFGFALGCLFFLPRGNQKKEARQYTQAPPSSGLSYLDDINMDEDDRNEWSAEHDDDC